MTPTPDLMTDFPRLHGDAVSVIARLLVPEDCYAQEALAYRIADRVEEAHLACIGNRPLGTPCTYAALRQMLAASLRVFLDELEEPSSDPATG